MGSWIRRSAALAAAGLVASLVGCGDGKPAVDTSREEATVKGTVTLRGKPVTKGEIRFDASNHIRSDVTASRAPIQPDGTYEVKTLVGLNRVSFAIPAAARDPLIQEASLEFEVKSGANTFDAVLPPKPQSAAP